MVVAPAVCTAKEALADSSQVAASRTTSDFAWGVGLGLGWIYT